MCVCNKYLIIWKAEKVGSKERPFTLKEININRIEINKVKSYTREAY